MTKPIRITIAGIVLLTVGSAIGFRDTDQAWNLVGMITLAVGLVVSLLGTWWQHQESQPFVMELNESKFEMWREEGGGNGYQIQVPALVHGKKHPVTTVFIVQDGKEHETDCWMISDPGTFDVVVRVGNKFHGKIVIK